MKITGLTTRLLKIDAAPRFRDGVVPPGRPSHWHFPLIVLHTDEGLDGYSMAYGPHGDGAALTEVLHESFWPLLRGADPSCSEALWQQLWTRQRHLYNQTDSLVGVIDVAVWDLRGKRANQSIASLLGQYTDYRRAYLTSRDETGSAEDIAREAAAAREAGYHGYKVQLRAGPASDIPRLRAARTGAGDGFRLMHDPNASYSLTEALAVGRELDALDFHWYEEPLPEAQLDHYRHLVETLRTPVVGGETVRLSDLPNFMTRRALTIARGDVLIKGGITGLRKAMAACELFGYNLEIHTANTPLLDVANLHVACASANTNMLEVHHPVFRFGLIQHPFDVGPDGCVRLPPGTGLGVELDWNWIDHHTTQIRKTP
ncbi:mandelate racemase/muconate lactonizing enzyme family protein [Synoicihabitans lomoniglobus]|uniref:Enolase C-terminal domain-like protein n=1 Tax=Synoicihabitans lomoniglobus TaxID=2909285 RepID=A0AAF0A1I9_9BACT|nr:hypothetical protein [Opitutaceae bacterium LMO-M01]WED65062.1 enolase C-terminal domain-like protein [Opitutaceae bacterium LMO-M01]